MIVLAIDTALDACQAALYRVGDGVMAERSEVMARGHAERVAPMIRDILTASGLVPKDLNRIAVTHGPGAFTGIRIGLAMARGLGLALGIPVIGIDTLEALAHGAGPGTAPLLVALTGRGEEFYAGLYAGDLVQLRAPRVTRFDAIATEVPAGPLRIAGPAADQVIARLTGRPILPVPVLRPDIAAMAALASRRAPGEHPPAPLYLRSADVKPQADLKRSLRPAQPLEAAVLSALHRDAAPVAWSADEFSQLMAMPGARALLAIEGAEPAGFVLARQAADETEIIMIATRPVFRRRGIARALLHALAQDLHGALFLEVAAGNSAARGLYRREGFAEVGLRRGYYQRAPGPPEDAIVMRRDLAP